MKKLLITATLLLLLSLKPLFAGVADGVDVKEVQRMLTELCFNAGPIDGVWGKKTEKAAKEFLASRSKEYSGTFEKKHATTLWAVLNNKENEAFFNPSKSELCSTSKKLAVPKKEKCQKQGVMRFDSKYEIPDSLNCQPNDETLAYYYKQNDKLRLKWHSSFKVRASKSPKKLNSAIKKSGVVDEEMATKTAFSYIYYQDGFIIYDATPAKERFSNKFNNKSYFSSHSMGKSITSYLLGHAICEGYISGIDAPISDWKLMENTLYYDQPIINLLNMQAGDTNVIKEKDGAFIGTGRRIHGNGPLSLATSNPLELKDTKPLNFPKFAYSNLTTDVLFNYIMHRTGSHFEKFIGKFYRDKIGIEYPVYLVMNPLIGRPNHPTMKQRVKHGAGQYGISATRLDFLRIAISMLDDWKGNTCEGKYLKEIFKRRVSIKQRADGWSSTHRSWGEASVINVTKSYAGQFWNDA